MVVDDGEHVAVEQHRLAAETTTQRIRDGQSHHQTGHRRRRREVESRVSELDVARGDRNGRPSGELHHVDAILIVDLDEHVVGLDGGVVDDDGTVPAASDEVPARFQVDLPPGVGSGCHRDPHAGMRVMTALTAEMATLAEARGEPAGEVARSSSPP